MTFISKTCLSLATIYNVQNGISTEQKEGRRQIFRKIFMYPDKIPKLLLGASQIICPENWDNEDSSSPIEFVTSRHCFTFRFVSLSKNTLQTIYPKSSFPHQFIKFCIETTNPLSPTNVLNPAFNTQTFFLPPMY